MGKALKTYGKEKQLSHKVSNTFPTNLPTTP